MVVVEIDERTVSEHGRWPWPRDLTAALIRAVAAGKPAAVALSMMFPESSQEDTELAAALAASGAVAGYHFEPEEKGPEQAICGIEPLPDGLQSESLLPSAGGVLCNTPRIADSLAHSGFLNAEADPDGMLRRLPLLTSYRGKLYPSLALATVRATRPGAVIGLKQDPSGAMVIRLGDGERVLDRQGRIWPQWYSKPAFQRVIAADLLAGRFDPSSFVGRIVMVGVTAKGSGDLWRTKIDMEYPGVYVHASTAWSLLQAEELGPVGLDVGWSVAMAVILGLATTALAQGKMAVMIPFLYAACFAPLYWSPLREYISPIPGLVSISSNIAVAGCLRWRRTRVQAQRNRQGLKAAQEFMLAALASLTALRDVETGGHLERIQRSLRMLCESLQDRPRFAGYLTPETIDLLVTVAPIHDIGKIGIPDEILLKKGRLTVEEMSLVKLHVHYGREVLEKARAKSGLDHPVLFEMCSALVFSHHERWDGSGYPCGLSGEAIPLPARLLAVVDVYDALVSRRVYKPEYTHAEAVLEIEAGRGTQFDPEIVDAFLAHQDRICPLSRAKRAGA